MFMVAEREPVACGVKVTVIVQLPPAGTLPPQLLVCAKSPGLFPVKLMPLMLSVTVPTLVNLTGAPGLVVPTGWLPKFTLLADSFTIVPVPLSDAVCGLPGASS
jgi:hypothetical protein